MKRYNNLDTTTITKLRHHYASDFLRFFFDDDSPFSTGVAAAAAAAAFSAFFAFFLAFRSASVSSSFCRNMSLSTTGYKKANTNLCCRSLAISLALSPLALLLFAILLTIHIHSVTVR